MKGARTALMMAAKSGHLEVVKALIEAGADVNLKSNDWVCYLGNAYVTESIIESLRQFCVLGLPLSFYVHAVLYISVEFLYIT